MNFASVCSGILGAELAWEPLGWTPAWCAEIDPFCCRLIAHRRPGLENLGDFTQATPPPGTIDVLGGGTPCQSFSSSGDRLGLDDPRGQLSLRYAALARRIGARWVVWENVPGVLSSGEGRDFGVFLGTLVECGFGVAYRVLDTCFYGLAQRRRRVWVVGYLGDWRPPAAVLFERPSLQGHPRAIRPKGTAFFSGARSGAGARCEVSHPLLAKGQPSWDPHQETLVSHTIGAGRGHDEGVGAFVEVPRTLRSRHDSGGDPSQDTWVAEHTGIRKLTPLERERIQGFPDGWTDIPGGSYSSRCKALGNAWPVPVARWIGQRIDQVDKILRGVA